MTVEKLHGIAKLEFLDFCQKLIRTPGLSGEEQAVADVVTAQCLSMKFDSVQRDNLGNVIAIRNGTNDGPVVLLDGHMDVVPVEEPQLWRHEPHGGEISEGKIWGRGAADTRCSLASMIWAAGNMSETDIHGTIVVAATVCEENITGVALSPILDIYKPEVVITGEPTGLRLGVAQKGRMTLFLHSTGRSAHTSTPEAGENAVEKMLDALSCLRDLKQPVDPDLGASILVLTEIISDPFPNGFSVPHGCHARLIGRMIPGEDKTSVLGRIQSGLASKPGIDFQLGRIEQSTYTGATIQVEDFLPGWRNSLADPWQLRLKAALQKAGLCSEYFYAPCGTNASASAKRGISSFIYGPGELSQAHIVDEWVFVEDVIKAEMGLRVILSEILCGNPNK